MESFTSADRKSEALTKLNANIDETVAGLEAAIQRENHTGTQAMETVEGLNATLAGISSTVALDRTRFQAVISGHTFTVGQALAPGGANFVLAQADEYETARVWGIVDAVEGDTLWITTAGKITTSGLTTEPDTDYYLSDAVEGGYTDVIPDYPSRVVPLFSTSADGTYAIVRIEQPWVESLIGVSEIAIDEVEEELISRGALTKNDKWDATVAPGPGNDSTQGYEKGSKWWDSADELLYECVDDTATAAVWVALNGAAPAEDTAAPVVTSASVTDDILTVNFNEPVILGVDGIEGFALAFSGGAVTVLSLSSGAGTASIQLQLSRFIHFGETGGDLDFTEPTDGISDVAGNPLETFANQSVTNSTPQITAPTGITATHDGALFSASWEPVDDATEYEYQVTEDDAEPDGGSWVSNGSATTITDESLPA